MNSPHAVIASAYRSCDVRVLEDPEALAKAVLAALRDEGYQVVPFARVDRSALRALLASGPLLADGSAITPAAARSAAVTVAEMAPEDIPVLLDMLGITGADGPDDGKWANYSFGRPSATKKEVRSA